MCEVQVYKNSRKADTLIRKHQLCCLHDSLQLAVPSWRRSGSPVGTSVPSTLHPRRAPLITSSLKPGPSISQLFPGQPLIDGAARRVAMPGLCFKSRTRTHPLRPQYSQVPASSTLLHMLVMHEAFLLPMMDGTAWQTCHHSLVLFLSVQQAGHLPFGNTAGISRRLFLAF